MAEQSARKLPFITIEEAARQELRYIRDRMDGKAKSLLTPWRKFNEASMNGIEWGSIITVAGMSGSGKCLGKGTHVLMYDNTLKKVENIILGDKLMGPDSKPKTVLSTTIGREQMYWVRQNKGIDYRVNESHILSLMSRRDKDKDRIKNISVKDILKENKSFLRHYKGYKAGSLSFRENTGEMLIDPYFLGIWLGDGDQSTIRITTIDQPIVDVIYRQAEIYGLKVTKSNSNGRRTPTYNIAGERGNIESNPLKEKFKYYGLLFNKHIPEVYMNGTYTERLELLAGLLDTDGYYASQGGYFEITQKNLQLADQIVRLARSVGFYVTFREKNATLKERNYTCTVARVCINGECNRIPTKIARKQARIRSKRALNFLVTGIQIEKDIVDNYYGFELDGDGLFLLEDQTVTHNTAILNELETGLFEMNPHENFAVLSFNFEMIARRLVGRKISKKLKVSVKQMYNADLVEPDKNLSIQQYEKAVEYTKSIKDVPVWYVDMPGSVQEIRNTIEAFNNMEENRYRGILVTLDHSILVKKVGEQNQVQALYELGAMFNEMKKKIKSSYVVVSQLNRDIEKVERIQNSSLHYPQKSDVFGADALYQYSDVFMVTHRPEMLNIQSYGIHSDPTAGLIYWHYLKTRDGDPFVAKMRNLLKYNQVIDYD